MNGLMQTAKRRLGDLERRLSQIGSAPALAPDMVPELGTDVVAFLDPIDRICAEPPPRYASTLYPITALVLCLLAVGTLIRVDIVVTAGGRLITSTPPILIQPVDRAIIREMRVRPGDTVHKGDILATLDPTFARADLGSLAAQRAGWQAQQERLEAEINDRPFKLAGTLTAEQRLQATLYEQRQANYASRLKVFSEDIERLNATIKAAEQDISLLSSQLSVARDVEEMRLSLMKSQNGSRLNYLESQSVRMRSERDYQDSVSRLTQSKHEVQSRQAERQAFIDDWRRQSLEALATVQTQLSMIGETINKASFVNDAVTVTAPDDGVVLDVAQRTVGSILHEAEPLLSIIPAGAKMVAEINISSSDVGNTKAGDLVLLKIDAFPYSRHGMVKGKLLFISEESAASSSLTGGNSLTGGGNKAEEGGAFHRGQVELTDTTLRAMPQGAHLIPGMTLRAEIKTGTRSIIGFFLAPVTSQLGEAMREP